MVEKGENDGEGERDEEEGEQRETGVEEEGHDGGRGEQKWRKGSKMVKKRGAE